MPLRALLFDFDGLLIDTESTEYRAWCELYERHGQRLELSDWSTGIGTLDGFDPVAHLASRGVSVSSEDVAAQHRRNLDLCALEELRPGIVDVLDAAERRGIATAIVSSSSSAWVTSHLEPRNLLGRFAHIVCADHDVARAKPRPVLYREALERLGIAAREAIAFEDSPNGVAAARAAGIYCVAVPNEITRALDLSRADMVLDSLERFDLDAVCADDG